MNHKKMILAIAAIVAAVTLTATSFAIPQQQALAWGHHNHHKNHSNSIKVDQQINQLNQCTGVPLDNMRTLDNTGSSTVCVNQADNSADIHR
jgi:hypothetical protein